MGELIEGTGRRKAPETGKGKEETDGYRPGAVALFSLWRPLDVSIIFWGIPRIYFLVIRTSWKTRKGKKGIKLQKHEESVD